MLHLIHDKKYKEGNKKMIIPCGEIHEILKGCYTIEGKRILIKHSLYKGEREFAIALIEECMGLLSEKEINDKFVIQYLQGLISLATPHSKQYEMFLNTFIQEPWVIEDALNGEKLSREDSVVIKNLMQTNIGEYMTKGEFQSCCYTAMLAFFQTAYCILEKKIGFHIRHIDMIADLDDELESIHLYESDKPVEIISIDWHSSNKINSIYMLYKNQYAGLDKSSILDLVSADVIEEDYYYKDERFSIAPSILTKQYCSIIDHEVNELIQLLNLPNKPQQHLMWNKMKKYVKDNNIDLEATDFSLSEALEDLHDLRNKGAHGDVITKDEYKIISRYKDKGIFQGISIEKLRIKNGKIHPTIDEISEYMGIV